MKSALHAGRQKRESANRQGTPVSGGCGLLFRLARTPPIRDHEFVDGQFLTGHAAEPDVELPVVRWYGDDGGWLTLLHGGPGAPGHLAPVARALAAELRILEPFERRSGATPLTVDLHVRDIDNAIRRHAGTQPTALLGFSSGAITALAYAAAHPERVSQLVLVAAATMEPGSREQFRVEFAARLSDTARSELQRARTIADGNERLRVQLAAMAAAYFVDPITTETEDVWYDVAGHDETWNDMLRLQESGRHPADFAAIATPVLMIHGADDPHPGASIRATLARYIPHLEYCELPRCGHYPWLERGARDAFLTTLRTWLTSPRVRVPRA
jgi:pimeloyl-ACP methyl ester carboxylesterase